MKKSLYKYLAALLALALLLGCASGFAEAAEAAPESRLTLSDLEAKGAKAYTHDGRVTFVDGACTVEPVRSMEDAAAVVNALTALLGGDDRTRFEPWRSYTDTVGNVYYVFQQMYAEITVPGGAVKVVTSADGNMLGLIGSVEDELPDVKEADGITAQQAEAITLQSMKDTCQAEAELVEGHTGKAVLPVCLELDPMAEKLDSSNRFVWVVYTNNPGGSAESASDLPYLAHYVTMTGEYLYSLPAIMPGDAAASTGFNAAYVFEFMEPAAYTGTVTLSDGTEKEISIDLMRDTRTGMYYLGNLERRIVVGDCYEFLYNKGHVVLEASPDNTGWDNTCLISLYNYCRAWDYYKAIGWNGGDGNGTPILVLKDFCNSFHEPINNAAYAGHFYGWQTFLSSDINDFSQCLDVLAHEFTHCVTGSIMTYNAYLNDYGAINEAMSDIQGNICEMMNGATEDTTWLLGENSLVAGMRSMSDPHRFNQPEYTWDYYYQSNVNEPTLINDHGGVHTNSSLLNNVAYRLCADGGMTLEEARAFWFAVDGAMVPGTDYAQLSELMPWVLKNQGLDKYMTALEAAIDATRLRSNDVPDTFDDDRALVTLTLPDEARFQDGNWGLRIFSVDAEGLSRRLTDILEDKGEYEGWLDTFFEALFAVEYEGQEVMTPEVLVPRLLVLCQMNFGDLIRTGTGVAGQDGRTVRLVSGPGLTVPVLFRLEADSDQHLASTALAVYTFGQWIDVASTVAPLVEQVNLKKLSEEGLVTALIDAIKSYDGGDTAPDMAPMLGAIMTLITDPQQFINQLLFTIQRGAVNEIPGTGLENVGTLDKENFPLLELLSDREKLMEALGMTAGTAVDIDYGESTLYTQAELQAAVVQILAQFASFEGCELHALRYAGDVCNSTGNILWMNSLEEGKQFTQVAEFLSDFHSPVEGGGAWEADSEYKDWQWWLAREEGGDWHLLTWGY